MRDRRLGDRSVSAVEVMHSIPTYTAFTFFLAKELNMSIKHWLREDPKDVHTYVH